MDSNEEKLRETRRNKIPEIIKKYESLADQILKQVSEPLPLFVDIIEEDTGAIKVSREMQMYDFIGVRKSAIDVSNRIMLDVNNLEIELQCPEYLNKPNDSEDDEVSETSTTNYAKQRAARKNKTGK